MAIQTRQSMSGLRGVVRVAVGVAGTVAVGAALVMGGLGWRQAAMPAEVVVPAQPAVLRSVPLGVDLPAGVDARELPQGYRDYLRPQEPIAPVVEARQPVTNGIDLPVGAALAALPAGLTDYIRPELGASSAPAAPARVAMPVLGVDAPAEVDVLVLPQGYRDYIRPQAQLPRATNHPSGTDAPAGVDRSTLPTGYTDYIRSGQ